MSSSAEAAIALVDEIETESTRSRLPIKKVLGYTSVAGLTAGAYFAEKYHLMSVLPGELRLVGNTLGHPGPGYMGARLAIFLSKSKNKLPIILAAASGALATDAAQEVLQSVLIDHDNNPSAVVDKNVRAENRRDLTAAEVGGLVAATVALNSSMLSSPFKRIGNIIQPKKWRGAKSGQYEEV